MAGQGVNANGQDTIIQTSDGGLTWFDISGGGPHAGIHGMSLDSQRRVLVSTDGGLWRLNTNGSWDNLNGDLAISLVNGVASNPVQTTTIFAGSRPTAPISSATTRPGIAPMATAAAAWPWIRTTRRPSTPSRS